MATTLSLSPPRPNLSRLFKGREVPLYGLTTSKLLCETNLNAKNLRIRKIVRNNRIYAAKASMVGRKAKEREIVIPDPDYRIPIVFLDHEIERTMCARLHTYYSSKEGISAGFVYLDNLLAAAPVGLLGLLLLFQTTRVRFVFDEEALEVKIGDQLMQSGENVFVGGKNRWKYSTFVNWELWWPQFPILVYFKETQTKPEGQVHFFPVIFNGKQLYDVMAERAGPSKTSSPQ